MLDGFVEEFKKGWHMAFGGGNTRQFARLMGDELNNMLLTVVTGKKPERKKRELPNPKPTVPAALTNKEGIAFGRYGRRLLSFPANDIRHKLVIGPTRSGKTEWALNYAVNLARAGRGFCYLDNADGEAVDRIRDALPEDTLARLVILDYSDRYHPLPAGIIAPSGDIFGQDQITSWWVDFFASNFGIGEQWMTQELLGYCCRAAFGVQGSTLLEVIQMAVDPAARNDVLARLDRRLYSDVLRWWNRFEAENSPEQQKNIAASFMRRAGVITQRPALRQIVCQVPRQQMDFRRWIDEEAIILVKAQKSMGSLVVRTVMALTMLSIWAAALSRDNVPIDQRTPYMVIADEPQSWLSGNADVLDDLFSQAQKYGLGMVCLFQSLAQVEKANPALLRVILNNSPDLLLFRDAVTQLKLPLEPVPKYHFVARIADHAPFAAKSLGKLEQVADRGEMASQQKKLWGQHYLSVNEDIERRLGVCDDAASMRGLPSESLKSGSSLLSDPDSPIGICGSSSSSLRLG